MNQAELTAALGAYKLFEPIADDPEAMALVAGILELKTYARGEEIIHKNEEGDCAFILLSGEVEVFDYTMDQEPFTRAILTGEMHTVFGEVALVAGGKRIATVAARSTSRCGILHRQAFRKLGDARPDVGWKLLWQIAQLLSMHLEKTNQDVLRLFEALVLEVEHKTIY